MTRLPGLSLEKLHYGSHQQVWDLGFLLYKNGALTRRDNFVEAMRSGQFGAPLSERIELVERLHEVVLARIEAGKSEQTIRSSLKALKQFWGYLEDQQVEISLSSITSGFLLWCESMIHRVRIKGDLQPKTALSSAKKVGALLGRVLGNESPRPAAGLLRLTRIGSLGGGSSGFPLVKADEQDLSSLPNFGHLLADISHALDAAAIRGPRPISVDLSDGSRLVIGGGLRKPEMKVEEIVSRDLRLMATRARMPLGEGESVIDQRPSLLNQRIEAELLIFIAQTGMNLSQAAKLKIGPLRWQSKGEDLLAFRVYKDRRAGEAEFRCFKEYREHLRRYVSWLGEVGLRDMDERIFPFVAVQGKIPSSEALPTFQATRGACAELGVLYIAPRELRKSRVNWLLRYVHRRGLVAKMVANSELTLIREYIRPSPQIAAVEITRFHAKNESLVLAPGPGLCADSERGPIPIAGIPAEAPKPDCISPDGCLFCIHHRDVLSKEYCWKLTSHLHLKKLELALTRPTKNAPDHPVVAVIDRLRGKLKGIAAIGSRNSAWSDHAEDAIRSGNYHPAWDVEIRLLEALI
ncbi:hypothetical protein ACIPRS_08910 [Pseudoxanthomonas sp. LARHCG66]